MKKSLLLTIATLTLGCCSSTSYARDVPFCNGVWNHSAYFDGRHLRGGSPHDMNNIPENDLANPFIQLSADLELNVDVKPQSASLNYALVDMTEHKTLIPKTQLSANGIHQSFSNILNLNIYQSSLSQEHKLRLYVWNKSYKKNALAYKYGYYIDISYFLNNVHLYSQGQLFDPWMPAYPPSPEPEKSSYYGLIGTYGVMISNNSNADNLTIQIENNQDIQSSGCMLAENYNTGDPKGVYGFPLPKFKLKLAGTISADDSIFVNNQKPVINSTISYGLNGDYISQIN